MNTVHQHIYRAATAAACRARQLHAAVLDRTGGHEERDRGGVLETVILTVGLAAAAILVVTVITGAVNRYGNVLAGLNP